MNGNKKKLSIRPHARLLTMLGDQLIKNERIALIELIKNSYDADANWAQIRFNDFDEIDDGIYQYKENSSIEIEDDGIGMTSDTIEKAWMIPATPIKHLAKLTSAITPKGRIIQGDKGIGRFATLKIGSTIRITSRSIEKNDSEIVVSMDFNKFDIDFTEIDGERRDIYLDELSVEVEIVKPPLYINKNQITLRSKKIHRLTQGTIIQISNLKKHIWTKDDIDSVMADVQRLQAPFRDEVDKEINESSVNEKAAISNNKKNEFIIDIVINGKSQYRKDEIKEDLTGYFDKAPIVAKNGYYDDSNNTITFEVNDVQHSIDFDALKGFKEFRDRFCDSKTKEVTRQPVCGSFQFNFYIFDLTYRAPARFKLTNADKKIIRKHRVYLYRDEIRVYPYGDPDDDWLRIDTLRGTGRAGDYLSMDQTFGNVSISQQHNPKLMDKTNREGLLEIDGAFEDFKVILRGILGYLRKEYSKYRFTLDTIEKHNLLIEGSVEKSLTNLAYLLEEIGDPKYLKLIKGISRKYLQEKEYFIGRSETSEDLASVGLSVELASHDMMLMMEKAKNTLNTCINMVNTENMDTDLMNTELLNLKDQITFVEEQLSIIQPIFRSSKRPIRRQEVIEAINNVNKYFGSLIIKHDINVETNTIGPTLNIRCMDAVLLQTFLNLFDNAVYWLSGRIGKKEIKILVNGDTNEVIFADNGPGVNKDDVPYIFEPFFSTKGLEGRGLGLYIARQILERSKYRIEYLLEKSRIILPGANFLITFIPAKKE